MENPKEKEKSLEKEIYKEDWDVDAWELMDPDDLWAMDKLIVSKKLSYKCGPMGSKVPWPGNYIVRPIINNLGMGHLSRIEYIENISADMHPAEFWCEIFTGRHISVDYEWGQQILAVEGTKHNKLPLQRFIKWEKVADSPHLPECLVDISKKYRFMNCEFVGGKIIEVHFRRNPDFRWGNSVMIPKWHDESIPDGIEEMQYFPDPPNYPGGREGVFVSWEN